jgi:hypothetical protein
MAKIILIQFAGEAPRKVEDRIYIPTRQGPVTLAFPRLVMTPPTCSGGRLVLTSAQERIETELIPAEDINRIAAKNLEDRMGRVIAKAVARAVAKQVVIHGAANQANNDAENFIAALLNFINIFVEHADTRSWRTLPGVIYISRIFVPAGEYQPDLTGCRNTISLYKISVRANETRFLFYDARYPCSTAECRN